MNELVLYFMKLILTQNARLLPTNIEEIANDY